VFCQDLARLNLEVDCRLDQQWVEVKHALEVARHELVLNVVAAVVQATGTDVATCTLQAMRLRLHLWKVSLLHGLRQGLQRWVQRKHFQLAQHLVEDFILIAKEHDSFGDIDWLVN